MLAYDLYPKAKVHLLILPRRPVRRLGDLRRSDAPLVRQMARLATWTAAQLRAQRPSLAPLRAGFHVVPSMPQLHLHLLSLDLDSPSLKAKHHFNSFATDHFVSPRRALAELEGDAGLVRAAQPAAETAAKAGLKRDMVCPLTGMRLANIPALKQHLAATRYARALEALRAAEPGGDDVGGGWPPLDDD